MQAQNRCLYLDPQHRLKLVLQPKPVPTSGQALVRITANGICGSDIHFYKDGRLGNFIVDRPYIPGHEACGVIEALGENTHGFAVGQRVVIEPGIPCGHCKLCRQGRYNLCPEVVFLSAPPIDGTFCDNLCVSVHALHPMPDHMTDAQGAMVEPAAVAVHAVMRSKMRPGASAAIIGMGPIGLLTLQAFKAAGGAHVTCLDFMPERLKAAKAMGADEALTPDALLTDSFADVVFETAGSAAGSASMPLLAAPGGVMVQVGWPGGNLVTFDVAACIDKELEYRTVNRYANAFSTAISWISDGRIDVSGLITHTFDLAHADEAFAFAAQHPDKVLKVLVTNA